MRYLQTRPAAVLVILLPFLSGCGKFFVPQPQNTNNNLIVQTLEQKTFGPFVQTSFAPSIPVSGAIDSNQSGYSGAVGSTAAFSGTTAATNASVEFYGISMPAAWDITYNYPVYCLISASPLVEEKSPMVVTPLYPGTSSSTPTAPYTCVYGPSNGVIPYLSLATPQVALDTAMPTTLQLRGDLTIASPVSSTSLSVYNTSLASVATAPAMSIAPDGSSALFPYPTNGNSSLPPGGYVGVITAAPPGGSPSFYGAQPFFIAHNDTSYLSAFGVDAAMPVGESVVTCTAAYYAGRCAGQRICQHTISGGGSPYPIVTLLTQSSVAIGSSSTTIQVGSDPTVILGYNNKQYASSSNYTCGSTTVDTTGTQSALVVNTGSNSVSLLSIGNQNTPSGTVPVGQAPVAAAITTDNTHAYIANYGSGTVSEIDLANVLVSRTIGVMPQPASLVLDTNGNLWIGGQGYLDEVNLASWTVVSSTAVDGTINGLSLASNGGALVESILQNGDLSARNPGGTLTAEIAFGTSSGLSYATTSTMTIGTGAITAGTLAADNSVYAASPMASYLAFPAEVAAASMPISYTSGDMVAVASGTNYQVSQLSTGTVFLAGTMPYTIRGIAMNDGMVFITMPESNSVVSIPIIPTVVQ